MMIVTEFLVFASAFAASIAVFWLTLAPALPRIVSLLRDGVDPVMTARPILTVSAARVRVRVHALSITAVPRQVLRATA